MTTTTILKEQTEVEHIAHYLDELEAHEPNEETIAAILEGDELARAYCARFIENEETTTK